MRRSFRAPWAICFLLICLVSCGRSGCSRFVPPALERLFAVIGSAPGFTATVQERTTTKRGDVLVLRSRWLYKKPHRLRMETEALSPELPSRLVVFDGSTTWIQLGNTTLSSDTLPEHLWFFDGLRSDTLKRFSRILFLGKSVIDGTEVERFEFLIDRNSEQHPMARIQVAFATADGIPRQIAGFDDAGTTMIDVGLSNVAVDGALDDKLFVFSPPPGAIVEKLR